MRKLKILQIVTLSELGGAQKVVYHLATGLDRKKFITTVACNAGGELVNWLREAPQPIEVIEIPELKRDITPLYDLIALYRLYKLIRQERFDIIHCHSSKAGLLGRLAGWLAGVPRIFFTVHGWGLYSSRNPLLRTFYASTERLAGFISTRVICVSKNDISTGIRNNLVNQRKLTLIYNGLPEQPGQPGLLRQKLGLSDTDMLVGMVARLAPQKNPLFFLETASRLLDRKNYVSSKKSVNEWGLYFVVIGDGPLMEACRDYIRNKDLQKNVFLLGSREDAAQLVYDFNIFALFSRWEGLPLTIIEAMLARIPVVASNVGGVGELVIDGKTGLLVPSIDYHAAEEALWSLITSEEKCRHMGEAGRVRAREIFSLPNMLREYREIYLKT